MSDHIKFASAYPLARHTHAEAETAKEGGEPLRKMSVELVIHLDRDGYFKPSFSVGFSSGSFMSSSAHIDIDGLDAVIEQFEELRTMAKEYKTGRLESLVKEKEALESEIEKQAEALEEE